VVLYWSAYTLPGKGRQKRKTLRHGDVDPNYPVRLIAYYTDKQRQLGFYTDQYTHC
jgi:hypothetical protein